MTDVLSHGIIGVHRYCARVQTQMDAMDFGTVRFEGASPMLGCWRAVKGHDAQKPCVTTYFLDLLVTLPWNQLQVSAADQIFAQSLFFFDWVAKDLIGCLQKSINIFKLVKPCQQRHRLACCIQIQRITGEQAPTNASIR